MLSTVKSCKENGVTNMDSLPFARHFLPAHYPRSVCQSYASYASHSFLGSVAGAAAMVLSTQALLVAVGVGAPCAAPMAAALNWALKDGAGQLGGVLFARRLGTGGGDAGSSPGWWRRAWRSGARGGGGGARRRGNVQGGTADTNPKR